MILKQYISLITDMAFAAGVFQGILNQQAHVNATAGVKEARERLERALDTMQSVDYVNLDMTCD